ncbi:pilus assembly protein PilM [bacterium]|nr:pilus assembly protein PilM [bacterium]
MILLSLEYLNSVPTSGYESFMRTEKSKKAAFSRSLKHARLTAQSCIGLEIDSASIKAAQIRIKPNGTVQVEKIAVAELKYFAFTEVPAIIRSFLKEHGFKRQRAASCFPRNLSTIRFLHLPSVNARELKEMVDFQSMKQIPYNKEDMIVDYEIVSQGGEGYSNVLLAITHRNVIFQHLDTLEAAGLNIERIDINSRGIFRAYRYFAQIPETAADGKPKTADALIDIDYAHTTIQVMDEDNLLFTRAITLGINHLLLKEKKYQEESANANWQAELIEELYRSFAVFYREHTDYKLRKILLCGGAGNFLHIEQNISARFGIPVEMYSFTDKIEFAKGLNVPAQINGKQVSLMGVIGLLLPGAYRPLNLIPPQVKSARKRQHRLAKLSVTALLCLGLAIAGSYKFYEAVNVKALQIESLQQQVGALAPRVDRLEAMRSKIEVIREQFTGKRSSLDFLRELYVVIPEKIFLSAFLYDETKYIVIKGTAENMSEVFDLIPKLENSPYFEKVSSRGVKRRKVADKEVIDFEIQCSLIKDDSETQPDTGTENQEPVPHEPSLPPDSADGLPPKELMIDNEQTFQEESYETNETDQDNQFYDELQPDMIETQTE